MKQFLAALFSLAFVTATFAQQNDQTISCKGPFGKNASHADVVKAFGASNVTYGDVPGPEGSTEQATIVFANDLARRLEIQWHDADKRRRPIAITVQGESKWQGPYGVRIGSTVQEIEEIAGKPFTITGFEWDLGGFANLQKTKFEKVEGGCTLSVRFAPKDGIPQGKKYQALTGDRKLRSNGPLLREVKPLVQSFTIGYGE